MASVGLLFGACSFSFMAVLACVFLWGWNSFHVASFSIVVIAFCIFALWQKIVREHRHRGKLFHITAATLGVLSLPIYVFAFCCCLWLGLVEYDGR